MLIARIMIICLSIGMIAHASSQATSLKPVYIERPGRQVEFQAEIVQTPQALAQGLMGRPTLDPTHGMLFIFPETGPVQFWMKETYIPLDLIFIDDSQKVVEIHLHAQPLSLDLISSHQPIKYVLEVLAGNVKSHDIRCGDHLIF